MRSVFSRGPMLRITSLSLAVWVLIFAAIKYYLPEFPTGKMFHCLLAIPGIFVYCGIMFGSTSLFRSRIAVRKNDILFSQGQTACLIKNNKIESARLYRHRSDLLRLKLGYRHRRKLRTRTCIVSNEISVRELTEFLPVDLVVHDVRDRKREFYLSQQNKSSKIIAKSFAH